MIFENADTRDLHERSLWTMRMQTQGIFSAEADTMSSEDADARNLHNWSLWALECWRKESWQPKPMSSKDVDSSKPKPMNGEWKEIV